MATTRRTISLKPASEPSQRSIRVGVRQVPGYSRLVAADTRSPGFSQAFYRAELFKELGFATRDDFLTGYWDGVFAHKDANNLLVRSFFARSPVWS